MNIFIYKMLIKKIFYSSSRFFFFFYNMKMQVMQINTSTIFNLHHEIIIDYFTPSFNSLVNLASDVMELSD